MDILAGGLDVVKAVLSLGLFAYAYSLFRTFRGGIMTTGFRFLAAAPLFFAATEIANGLHNFGFEIYQEKLLADALEMLFLVSLFVGFYLLAAAWRIKR